MSTPASKSLLSAWSPVGVWMLLIFLGSTDLLSAEHTARFIVPLLRWLDPHMSMTTIAKIHMAIRKLGHVTEYALLASLVWRAFRKSWPNASQGRVAAVSVIIAAAFAASDEFHQSFFSSRTASPVDVLIDSSGAFLAVALCLFVSRRPNPAR